MEELKEHVEEVKEMIQQLVTSVFTHRYRDVKPEIRAMCMTEMGEWMDKNRFAFVRDEYLRYLGWCLHDSSADVRLCVTQSLITVYSNSANKENLKLFTSRFKAKKATTSWYMCMIIPFTVSATCVGTCYWHDN
jgi:cohesin complex subunit SA-1/2